MTTYEYSKTLSLLNEYDVLVVGGGPAGIAAAVTASRNGARTALIEKNGVLGGNLTIGNVNPILGKVAPGTIRDELIELFAGNHPEDEPLETRNGSECHIDVEEAKTLLANFVNDNNVTVYLQTPLIDVLKDGSQVSGVVIGTPTGNAVLKCRCLVDATGDGYAAFLAGAEYRVGRDSDGLVQPVTLEFTIQGVDDTIGIYCYGGSDKVCLPDGRPYSVFCREEHDKGKLPKNVSIVRMHKTLYPGERSVNATQANGFDTLQSQDIFAAELELRNQIYTVFHWIRNNLPGFENISIKNTPSTLGVRETRRIIGDYVISDSDVETGAVFEDAVVRRAWFLIDIHNPTGGGQAEGSSKIAVPYDIPYRALLPKGIDNLITAGRCISGSHRAHASYRVMSICMATGQAAGMAAALATKQRKIPRNLDVKLIQQYLQGNIAS